MLYKRPKSSYWWCQFTAPDGRRVRQSTKTVDKQQAQEFADTLKARYWRILRLGEKPRRTWKEAAVKWFKETSRRSKQDALDQIKWVDPYLGKLYLDEINREVIDKITQAKSKTGVKPATVNKMLEIVRVILNTALKEWEWIDRVPRVCLLKTENARIRWITKAEAIRLLGSLPGHLRYMVAFSLATGLRRNNVTGLEWSQVDLSRQVAWIHGDQSKSGRPIGVPLNSEAIAVLRGQLGKHPVYCFTYRGNKVIQVNTKDWRKQVLPIFAGMIYGIPGQVGMYKVEHPFMCYRNWVAGQRSKWCADMRIWPPNIYPHLPAIFVLKKWVAHFLPHHKKAQKKQHST